MRKIRKQTAPNFRKKKEPLEHNSCACCRYVFYDFEDRLCKCIKYNVVGFRNQYLYVCDRFET